MAENNGYNSIVKTVITGVVTAIVGAMIALLLKSNGQEVQTDRNMHDIAELKAQMMNVQTERAGDKAKLEAIQSKVNDIWQVVVTQQRGR